MIGDTPLHIAVRNGYKEIVSEFKNKGASVYEKSGYTLLHSAAANGHDTLVTLLIQSGANLTAKDDNDATPLHLATIKGYTDIQEILKCSLVATIIN